MTYIMLIRHGETEWNALGLYQGHLNSPLTKEGHQQARALAQRLRGHRIDVIYTSDLGRTQETAAPLAKASGLEPRIDARLRERNYGIFQGLEKSAVKSRYPAEYAAHHAGDPDYQIPDGESTRQFHERTVTCLEDLADRHQGEHIAIVAHGGGIGMTIKYVLGLDLIAPRNFVMPNTGYNLIVKEADGWMLQTLGDVSHLERGGLDDIE